MTQHAVAAGERLGTFTALQPAAGALGRFIGPLVFAASTSITQTNPRACNSRFSYILAYGSTAQTYLPTALQNYPTRVPLYINPSCKPENACLIQFPQYFFNGVRLSHRTFHPC